MRDEIPGAAFEHQTERIERATNDPTAFPVAGAQPALAPGGRGDRGQMRDRVLAAEPPARIEVEVALRPARTLLQLGWHGGQHLQACVGEHTTKAELRSRRRGDEQRLGLLRREARQLRSVAPRKPVPACGATHCLDGDAGGSQRLDVPVDRPHRYLEMVRELRRGQLPAHLQQEEQGDEPGRPHRAETYMTEAGMYMS